MLPSHAPERFKDRETLWNEVEKIEQHPKAQLAYSFDIALQNEFSMEENRQLVRQFLQDEFVSRGMLADYAIHEKDAGEGGIQNPHFHVLCPIRPLNPDGSWGNKQHREYILDERRQPHPERQGRLRVQGCADDRLGQSRAIGSMAAGLGRIVQQQV